MSQGVSQDALIRWLIDKGLFTKEFLEMVKVVNRERMKHSGKITP